MVANRLPSMSDICGNPQAFVLFAFWRFLLRKLRQIDRVFLVCFVVEKDTHIQIENFGKLIDPGFSAS